MPDEGAERIIMPAETGRDSRGQADGRVFPQMPVNEEMGCCLRGGAPGLTVCRNFHEPFGNRSHVAAGDERERQTLAEAGLRCLGPPG